MKIAIVFDSHTGNTKKVANVIKEAVNLKHSVTQI